ncbi:putative C-_U-editing enzyme APOBEC-4 [Apus apus]|uniref:putative C->U-editing enzyme APOBEC-4 n=1 Tax=Apus apus TaxID=8895 RepID=UPI0021F83586|nr:putative C->U-editing enzyme APOBEC-4 [Apus apus]
MNPGQKTIFQEYLTNQGTVVKPYCWQKQNHLCANCPFHIRTGEEARVPYEEFCRVFGFPGRLTATLKTKHLLFYELRSFSGGLVQKGRATNCTARDSHPESMLFEVGGYLDAVIDAYESIRCIILYSSYSPCNEAYHCCITKIYRLLLKYPELTLCIYFSQLYHAEDGFPTAAWNKAALQSLSSLWPRVTLQRLPSRTQHYLLCNFVYGIPGSTLYHPTLLSRTSVDRQNPHQTNNLRGMKPYFRNVFPQAVEGKAAVLQNLEIFTSPSLASQQPFEVTMSSQLPPMSQSHLVFLPSTFLPFQRKHLYPRPQNIVRHLKMPKEQPSETRNSGTFPSGRHLI